MPQPRLFHWVVELNRPSPWNMNGVMTHHHSNGSGWTQFDIQYTPIIWSKLVLISKKIWCLPPLKRHVGNTVGTLLSLNLLGSWICPSFHYGLFFGLWGFWFAQESSWSSECPHFPCIVNHCWCLWTVTHK